MFKEIFIVGRARSGTTVTRKALCTAGAFDCDEIMHPLHRNQRRFYAWLLPKIAEDPTLIHPARHVPMFHDFIAYLHELGGDAPLAIDLKYGDLSVLPAISLLLKRNNFLPNYLNNHQKCVIHIMRRNKLRVVCSETAALKTGVWGSNRAKEVHRGRTQIELSAQDLVGRIEDLIEKDPCVSDMLQNNPNYSKIFYEELFGADGNFSSLAVDIMSNAMGRDLGNLKPGKVKVNTLALEEWISNYAEIAEVLRATEHGWMLDADQ